jgi:hypothetical protein
LGKQVTVVVISKEPETRSLVVKVVVYAKVIFAAFLNSLTLLGFFYLLDDHISTLEDVCFISL